MSNHQLQPAWGFDRRGFAELMFGMRAGAEGPCPAAVPHSAIQSPSTARSVPRSLPWGRLGASSQSHTECTGTTTDAPGGLAPPSHVSRASSPAAAPLQSVPAGCRGRVGFHRPPDSHCLRGQGQGLGRAPALSPISRGLTSKTDDAEGAAAIQTALFISN